MRVISRKNLIEKILKPIKRDSSKTKSQVLRLIKEKRKDRIKLNNNILNLFSRQSLSRNSGTNLSNFSKEGIFLPEGTIFFDYLERERCLFVIQQEPQVRTIRFSHSFLYNDRANFLSYYIGDDYELSYLPQTARLAFPYMIFLFSCHRYNSGFSFYVFYSNKPVTSLHDFVYYPNLPNCSLGYVCTGFEGFSRSDFLPHEKAIELINHFWGSQFTSHSFESYFCIANRDRRFKNIWEWERNTLENPEFVLDVKWEGGKTLNYSLNGFYDYDRIGSSITNKVKTELEHGFGFEYASHLKSFVMGLYPPLNPDISFPENLLRQLAGYILSQRKKLAKGEEIERDPYYLGKGDFVKIKDNSRFYYQALNQEGEIIGLFNDFDGKEWLEVHFCDGTEYNYPREELVLIDLTEDDKIVRGSKVKIKESSCFHDQAPGITGKVVGDFGSYSIWGKPAAVVIFEHSSRERYYRRQDLELVT